VVRALRSGSLRPGDALVDGGVAAGVQGGHLVRDVDDAGDGGQRSDVQRDRGSLGDRFEQVAQPLRPGIYWGVPEGGAVTGSGCALGQAF
jgi:hypothetical protein